MTDFDLRIVSLGAGVQSSVMYDLAAQGELGPIPDAAIFADTQAEPPHVYTQVDRLEKMHGRTIPIHRVTVGSLEQNLYVGGLGRKGFVQIPAYLKNAESGARGIGRRQCTFQAKITPIERHCREMLGLKKGQRAAGKYNVEQWIGISTDEAHRAKMSNVKWVTRRYPLLFDIPMRRSDCLEYAIAADWPPLRSSSCFFCPYHRDREWRELRDRDPDLWERALVIDDDLRGVDMAVNAGLRGDQFLHDSLIPLRDVDLDTDRDQPDLFGSECEGVCGV